MELRICKNINVKASWRRVKMYSKRKQAFTLVEILVVILIIGLLFVFLVPKISSSTDKAREVGVKNDFHSYETALEAVTKEHGGLGASARVTASTAVDAINEYLDPALKIDAGSLDSTGSTLTSKKDPWNNKYHVAYIGSSTGNDGAVLILSSGKDSTYQYGSHAISDLSEIQSETGNSNAEKIDNKIKECLAGTDDFALMCAYIDGTQYTVTSGLGTNVSASGSSIASASGSGSGSGDSGSTTPSSNEDMFEWEGTTITALTSNGWSQDSLTIPSKATSLGQSSLNNTSSLKSLTIPGTVTKIGYAACARNDLLTSVTLGEGIKVIEGYAFSDNKMLESIVIPSSVTTLGADAFYNCPRLTSVTINAHITSIGEETFMGSGITGLVIPDTVTSIGNQAFMMSNLTSITIPDSVTSMGDMVFFGCPRLTTISAPAALRSTESSWLGDCTATVTYR